jgi:acetoacetyl-CoA synthetase
MSINNGEASSNADGEGPEGSGDGLERRLAALWARALEVDAVGVGDRFLDLGGDSISAIDLLKLMRDDFGLELAPAELLRAGTVERCAALIRAGSRPDRGGLIVPLIGEGSGAPLFLVHDVTGEVLSYSHLVRHLGPGREVYGIQSRGFEGIEPFRAIEEQAAFYVDALRAARPDGPYVLGGYSHGGPTAYEMARQLRAAGAEVPLVVNIDAANYNPTPPLRWDARTLAGGVRNIPLWIRDELLQMPRGEFRRRLQVRRSRLARWLGERPGRLERAATAGGEPGRREPSAAKEGQAAYLTFFYASYDARRRYIPGPYPGRMVLIRGRTQPLTLPHRHDLGWGDLPVGGLEVRVVPGGHNLLLPPFVERVADELRDCLRAIDDLRPA